MKNKKKAPKARVRSSAKKVPAKRRVSRKPRPLHKRLALHPVSVLFLLCLGVLLWGITFHSSADSYTVNAIVPAPVPPTPAVITSPVDQTHFTTTPVAVKGTCPENTYVNLSRNGVFSGSAICGPGQTTFEIDTDLSLGSNVLLPQVYNVTDQPGPASTPITVFLDSPPVPPPPVPPSPPTTLQVTSNDDSAFHKGSAPEVSPYVTIRGTAPPYSHIVITIHSDPIICITNADANGNWSCTLAQPLSPGEHTVNVVATTPQGQVLVFPGYQIVVSAALKPLQSVHLAPFLVTADFKYKPRISGQSFDLVMGLSGGTGPYAVTIHWGDGTQSTFARGDGSDFSAPHTYKLSRRNQQTYLVKIEAVDSTGRTAYLQVAELVHAQGSTIGLPVIGDIGANTPPLSQLKQGLWLVWPAYAVASLMVLSFWLGERQEYYNLFRHRHIRHRRA